MSEERARMSSVLGATGLVLGNVQGQGDFEVRGRVQGDIVLNGRVLVSAGGMVLGTIEAVHISISGTVRGDLIAEDGVEIAGSGQVDGNVTSPRVAIEAGAKVRGHLRTGEEPPPARRGTPEPVPQAEPSEEPAFEAAVVDAAAAPSEPPPLVVPPRAALPREGAARAPAPTAEPLDAKGPGAKRRRKRRRDRERDRESDGQGPPTDAAGTSASHVDEGRAEFTPPLRPTRPSGPLPPADRPPVARTGAERAPAERAPAERTAAQRGPRERPPVEARKDAKPAEDGSPERPRRGKPLPTFVKGARGHLRG
jgi:cytoskeletal protein CcmA (bactofilin family)